MEQYCLELTVKYRFHPRYMLLHDVRLSVCPFFRLSQTIRYCAIRAKYIVENLLLPYHSSFLEVRTNCRYEIPTVITPNRALNTGGI